MAAVRPAMLPTRPASVLRKRSKGLLCRCPRKSRLSAITATKITSRCRSLIELIDAIRATTADKINGIQKVTGLLRMLALNAVIESARAGAQSLREDLRRPLVGH